LGLKAQAQAEMAPETTLPRQRAYSTGRVDLPPMLRRRRGERSRLRAWFAANKKGRALLPAPDTQEMLCQDSRTATIS
jgi:hypothetical protein